MIEIRIIYGVYAVCGNIRGNSFLQGGVPNRSQPGEGILRRVSVGHERP